MQIDGDKTIKRERHTTEKKCFYTEVLAIIISWKVITHVEILQGLEDN